MSFMASATLIVNDNLSEAYTFQLLWNSSPLFSISNLFVQDLFLITFRNLKITDFDNSAICSTTLKEEVSATEFSIGTLCVAARHGVEGLQKQNNAWFLPEPRLPLTISPHLLQTLSTGVSYFIVDIPKLCCQITF